MQESTSHVFERSERNDRRRRLTVGGKNYAALCSQFQGATHLRTRIPHRHELLRTTKICGHSQQRRCFVVWCHFWSHTPRSISYRFTYKKKSRSFRCCGEMEISGMSICALLVSIPASHERATIFETCQNSRKAVSSCLYRIPPK